MKAKTFVILLIAVGILAGVAVMIFRPDRPEKPRAALGNLLIPSLPLAEIDRITIAGPESEALLVKSASGWTVENRYGFRADFSMVSDLVEKIKDLKIGREFPATEEIVDRLGLNPPEKKEVPAERRGTRVSFAATDGKVIVDLILGAARESDAGFGGQYVMPAGKSTVYLVDKTFKFIAKTPSEWIRKEALSIAADQIESVLCTTGGATKTAYRLERGTKDEGFRIGPADGRPLAKSKVDRLTKALSPLYIEDVEKAAEGEGEAADTRFAGAARFAYRLFNGTVYTVRLGRGIEKKDEILYPVKLRVVYRPLQPPAENGEDLSKKAAALESETGGWIFFVSDTVHDRFVTRAKDLVTEK